MVEHALPRWPAATSTNVRRGPNLWQRILMSRHATVGGTITLLLILAAVIGPWTWPYDPTGVDGQALFRPPSLAHPFGSDELGRDVLARVLVGARISLIVAGLSVALAACLGVAVGLAAGYFGGATDMLLMRIVDGFLAFPGLVLALSMVAFLGQNLPTIVVAIGVVAAPSFSRLVRSGVLMTRNQEFVRGAVVCGASDWRIMVRHILPNVASLIIVQASLNSAFALLSEASLAFLGLGLPPPNASWGTLLRAGYQFVGIAPWLSIVPGAAIFAAVLAFNLLGDGIRDALDPRVQVRGGPAREVR